MKEIIIDLTNSKKINRMLIKNINEIISIRNIHITIIIPLCLDISKLRHTIIFYNKKINVFRYANDRFYLYNLLKSYKHLCEYDYFFYLDYKYFINKSIFTIMYEKIIYTEKNNGSDCPCLIYIKRLNTYDNLKTLTYDDCFSQTTKNNPCQNNIIIFNKSFLKSIKPFSTKIKYPQWWLTILCYCIGEVNYIINSPDYFHFLTQKKHLTISRYQSKKLLAQYGEDISQTKLKIIFDNLYNN